MIATPRRRRPTVLALAAATVAVALAGCGSGGERATTTPTTEPTSATDAAREACTAVLDDRSADVSEQAAEATTAVRDALDASEPPTEDDLAQMRDALGAVRGQLADARDDLAEVEMDDADRARWSTVVESVDPMIADLDATIEFLREPDWERDEATIGLGVPTPDRVALDAALDGLDLRGTDCEWVYVYPGDPKDTAPFQHDAATACSVAVERRRDHGYDDATAADTDRTAEWEATVADLEVVESATLDDPALWDEVVDAARARADGDDGSDVTDALATLGLDLRPCAALFA